MRRRKGQKTTGVPSLVSRARLPSVERGKWRKQMLCKERHTLTFTFPGSLWEVNRKIYSWEMI